MKDFKPNLSMALKHCHLPVGFPGDRYLFWSNLGEQVIFVGFTTERDQWLETLLSHHAVSTVRIFDVLEQKMWCSHCNFFTTSLAEMLLQYCVHCQLYLDPRYNPPKKKNGN